MIISFFKTLYKGLAILCIVTLSVQAFSLKQKLKSYKKQFVQRVTSNSSKEAQDLKIWSGILENPQKFSPEDLIQFLESHTHWPHYEKLCTQAELVIAKSSSAPHIRRWFSSHEPKTLKGVLAYAKLLPKDKAIKLVIKAWEEMDLSPREEKEILTHFSKILKPKHHICRLNKLLWESNETNAKRLLAYVPPEIQKAAKLRLALLKGKAPPKGLSTKNEGVLYEIVRWHKKKKEWTSAATLLMNTPSSKKWAEKWWKERNYIAREFIALKKYKQAYDVLKNHNLQPGTKDFAEAHWLAGWISLRFLDNPTQARHHFEILSKNVKAALSKSRAYYWLGSSYEHQKKPDLAKKWYRKAANFKTTFYGQVAADKLKESPFPLLHEKPKATAEERKRFEQNDLVKVARLLKKRGKKEKHTLVKFLTCIASQAKTRAERELIVELTHTLSPTDVVWISRRAGNQDPVLLKIAYPTCSLPRKKGFPEEALLFAIAYQESHFNPQAESPKGAKGLLQLISQTARETAKSLGLHHTEAKIFDPQHNLILGSAHIALLLNSFQSYPLVASAYNAGPSPLKRWLKTYGDPRKLETLDHVIDWIEKIPYSETRHYVQRVLENVTNYRSRKGASKKTISDTLNHNKKS